jgi:hypothetical protein
VNLKLPTGSLALLPGPAPAKRVRIEDAQMTNVGGCINITCVLD